MGEGDDSEPGSVPLSPRTTGIKRRETTTTATTTTTTTTATATATTTTTTATTTKYNWCQYGQRRENVCQTLNIEAPETSFADILQRLVRRYLFKLERLKEESGKDGVNMISDSLLGATTEAYPTRIREEEPVYADSDETGDTDSSNYVIPPPPPPPQTDTCQRSNWKRRLSMRQGSTLSSSSRRRRTSMATGHPQVQLISIPQLDAIQRCLKLLDVRLQHVQSSARDDDRTRDDVGHIRKLMYENQKALSTVVTVLDSIQEEVRHVSVHLRKNPTISAASLNPIINLQPPRKKSASDRSVDMERGSREVIHPMDISQI
ncbi:hypothetical protein LSAT2_008214 [Lamellibrachia satsuma]|nr:hypothetical protein LSAT2_008214 [Lamellibrachia satsuma]